MLIRLTSLAFAITGTVLLAGNAQCQLPTTVQLPSISNFSYGGTVVVPVGGSAYLGGVKRAATGTTRRGLNRGFGQDLSDAQASVKVDVIDNAEIDRQILGGTPQEFLRRERLKEARGAGGQGARRDGARRDGARRDGAGGIDLDAEGKSLVRYARTQYKAGKHSAAFAGYQLAIENLTSQRLRDLATAEFKRVFGSSAAQTLQMSSIRRRF